MPIVKKSITKELQPKGDARPAAVVESLEQRILFSVDVLGLAGLNPELTDAAESDLTPDSVLLSGSVDGGAYELVVIDPGVEERSQLLADLQAQSDAGRSLVVVVLNENDSGIDAISQKLSLHQNISTVHIVSHGTESGIAFGTDWLSSETATKFADEFAHWQDLLFGQPEILLYGCNLAASEEGLALLDLLADETGAAIAASNDTTGHSSLAGDWDLEYTTGPIKSASVFSEDLQALWQNQLALDLLAVEDDFGEVLINTPIDLNNPSAANTNLLDNDQTSAPGIRLLSTSDPLHGVVTEDAAGQFQYKPAANYTGADEFEYIVTDSEEPILNHYEFNQPDPVDSTGRSEPNATAAQFQPDFNPSTGVYDWDGNDYLEIPDIDYGQDFTISLEFDVGALTKSENLFQHGASRSQNTINVSIESNILGDYLTVYMLDSSETGSVIDPYYWFQSVNLFDNSGWNKLMITHEAGGAGFELYLNTVNQNIFLQNQRGGDSIDLSGPINIGRYFDPDTLVYTDYLENHKIRNLRIYDEVISPSMNDNSIDYSTAAVSMELRDVNQQPTFRNLNNSPVYVENDPPIVLDKNVTVYDPELSAADNYDGAVFTLHRNGGANDLDIFSASGDLNPLVEGQPFGYLVGGTTATELGMVNHNSDGLLELQFNSAATQALVNQTLQSISYHLNDESPPNSSVLRWTFSDGFNGAGIFGTEEVTTQTLSVNVEDRPDIEIATPANTVELLEDTEFVYNGALALSHDQDPADAVEVEISVGEGILSMNSVTALSVQGNGTGTLVLEGASDIINNALRSLKYVPNANYNGADVLSVAATMGPTSTNSFKTSQISVLPVNDSPVFSGAGGTEVYNITGTPVIIDPDISISDIELLASGNYNNTSLTLTRTDAVDYAPSPQFETNDTDVYSSVSFNLTEGANVSDGTVDFGTVAKNSGGLLEIVFNGLANRSRIDSLIQSINYQNSSAWPPVETSWPHDSVVHEWTFNDAGITDNGSLLPASAQTGVGFSHIDITTTDPQPSKVINEDITIEVGAENQLLDQFNLTYIDLDTPDSTLFYQLTGVTAGVIVKNGGAEIGVGQSFTQADLNLGAVTVSSNLAAASVETIEFTVVGSSASIADSISVRILEDVPSVLQSGISLNRDDGNNAFLGDTSGYRFVDGNAEVTWEFLFSELSANTAGGESTLYSAASNTGHFEHLVIQPIPGTDDGVLEWDIKSLNPAGGSIISATIPGVFDGGLHSVALTLDLESAGRIKLYYDGVLQGDVDNGISFSGVKAIGGFPWVVGQQLLPGSDFSATGGFENYRFQPGAQFSGTMHDVRIWDEARTVDQINDSRHARFNNSPVAVPGLSVNWQMNDPDGDASVSTIVDDTPNAGIDRLQPSLQVGHVTGTGFTPSTVTDELMVADNALNGVVVGYVVPKDPVPDSAGYRFEIVPTGQPSAFAIDPFSGQIKVADNSLLSESVSHYDLSIRVTSTAVSGAAVSEVISLTINAVNEPPKLDLGVNPIVHFTEGDPAVVLNAVASVQDDELEATSFEGAILTIERYDSVAMSASGQPQDLFSSDLFAVTSPFYTVHENVGKLKLEFGAGATLNEVNNLLRSLKYENTSDDPVSDVTLQWIFSDENTGGQGSGGVLSDSGLSVVSITPVNDAPELGSLPIPFVPGLEDSKVEIDFAALASYAMDIDGDVVGVAVSAAVNGSIALVDNSGNPVSGNVIGLDEKVIWYPSPNINGQVEAFQLQLIDNEGAVSNVTETVVINLSPVSDPPIGADTLLDVNEDQSLLLDRGYFGFSDVDGDSFTDVTITDVTRGHIELDSADLVLPATVPITAVDSGTLKFIPEPDRSEVTATLEFRVSDGGTNSHALATNTINVDIRGVNDPPIGSSFTKTLLEDDTLSFAVSDFHFDDSVDISASKPAGDLPYEVIITAIPDNGALTLDGIALQVDDTVLFSEINAGFKYVPAVDNAIDSHFEFKLRDLGGVDDGGQDKSVMSYRANLIITPVNDAPTGADSQTDVFEGTDYTFDRTEFGFSDPADMDELLQIHIVSLPTVGTLKLGIAEINSPRAVSIVDIDAGLFVYEPPLSTEGNRDTSFLFSVEDDGGDDDGGIAREPGTHSFTITNRGINQPPVVDTNLEISATEETPLVLYASFFAFTDSENHALAAVQVTDLPTYGVLKLDNAVLTAPKEITTDQLDAASLVYLPNLNAQGIGLDQFSVRVRDAGGEINGGSDISALAEKIVVNIANVNDRPVLTGIEPANVEYIENIPAILSDQLTIEDVDSTLIQSAKISLSGNYMAGEDLLYFNDTADISGDFDSQTGTLTLTGAASIADYTSALRSVLYNNTSDNPTTDLRTVTFTVSDGLLDSPPVARNLTINAVNDAPVLIGLETQALKYTENQAPVSISDSLKIADVDSTTITSASVSIVSNYQMSEDVLEFTDTADISGTFDQATGVMWLTGTAGVADYELAIRSVTYQNTSEHPDTANRKLLISINDASSASTAVIREVAIEATNDAPEIPSLASGKLFYVENSAPVTIADDIDLYDIDSQWLESATISISGSDASSRLHFYNQNGISGSFDRTAGVLTLAGTAAVSDYQAAIRSVQFDSTSENPGSGEISISIVVNDGEQDSLTRERNLVFVPVNDAAVLSSIEVTSGLYVENADPVQISNSIIIEDVDNTELQSAVVKIGSGYNALEDTLYYTNSADINGHFDSATGALHLTGSASVNDYQEALRSVEYKNTSDNPSTVKREIVFQVSDGHTDSNIVHRDVNVSPVNDSPVLENIEDAAVAFYENQGWLSITNDIGISDIDDTSLESATIRFTGGYIEGEDLLKYTPIHGIIGVFDAVNGELDLSGSATVAQYEQALASVQYKNASDKPDTTDRSVTFFVSDDVEDSNAVSRTIEVFSVNDPPTGLDTHLSVAEGSIYRFKVADFGFTDSKDNNEISAIIIRSLPDKGRLIVNGGDVSVSTTVNRFDIDIGRFVYVPPVQTEGDKDTQFGFSVKDDGGTDHSGLDVDIGANTMVITNLGVNDAPVVNSGSEIELQEDTPIALALKNFGFSDPEGHTLKSVIIDTLPAVGELQLQGLRVNAGAEISATDIAANQLTYHPPENYNGSATLEFRVRDNGGTAHGGIDTAVESGLLTLSVTEVNDAPSGTSSTVSIIEDTPYVLRADQFRVIDIEDHQLMEVIITKLPDTGLLKLMGHVVESGTVIPVEDINNRKLVFHPEDNAFGIAQDSFQFLVRDDGGTTRSGSDTSATASTVSFDVVPVNDIPTGLDSAVEALEDTPLILRAIDFGYNDIEGDTLAGIRVATLPQQGNLFLGNAPVSINAYISAADLDDGRLQYLPDSNQYGSSYAQFAFYVVDSGSGTVTANVANVLSIHVLSVNDAPDINDATVSLAEDSSYVLSPDDFGYSDTSDEPDTHGIQSITVLELPAQGELLLSGGIVAVGEVIPIDFIQSGELQFIPAEHEYAQQYAQIRYLVTDEGGTERGGLNTSSPATLAFRVIAVNDSPVPADDSYEVGENASVSGNVLDNDSDADVTDQLTASLLTAPANGAVQLEDDGTFVYRHDGSETASDFFSYEVSDGLAASNAVVNVTVIPVNDAPVAGEIPLISGVVNQLKEISLPADLFVDPDIGDSLTIQMISADGQELPSWLEFNPQAFTLTGIPDSPGVFVVRLQASDEAGAQVSTDIVIDVQAEMVEPELAAARAEVSGVEQQFVKPTVTVTSSDNNAASYSSFGNQSEVRTREQPVPEPVEPAEFELLAISESRMSDTYSEPKLVMHKHSREIATLDKLGVIPVVQIPLLEELFQLNNLSWDQNESQLARTLDETKQGMAGDKQFALKVTSGITTVSTGLSLGYIVWLLRGGVLLSSVLTSLPAWRMMDPLPVLDNRASDDDSGDESLQEMVDTHPQSDSESANDAEGPDYPRKSAATQ